MSSPLLALFVRSLREDARSRATYWTRGVLGGFLLLMLLGFAASNRWSNAPGRSLFTTIMISQLVALTFVGLSYFTSAIAEEKEEQTLGLLRMTGLSPLAILLGKSTSRLCGALLLLVGQFPFTIIAITLGGISLRQIIAVYCAVGAFTFLFCNLALLGSVLARRGPNAAIFCLVAMAVFLGGAPLFLLVPSAARSVLGADSAIDRFLEWWWNSTPIARLQEVLATGFSGAPIGWQVVSNLALGVACFLLAWTVFERFCDRAPESAPAAGSPPRRFFGFRLRRPPRPWKDALLWKDFYFLCGGYAGFAVRFFAYGGTLIPFLYRSGGAGTQFGIMRSLFTSIVPFVFSVDVAAMASRIFRSELHDQTLTDLAMLPLTMRHIVYRKALACVLAAAPGALAVLMAQGFAVSLFKSTQSSLAGAMSVTGMNGLMIMQMCGSWVHVALLVYVVAWLSLSMKRGSLALGYVLTYALNIFLATVIMAAFAATGFMRMAAASRSGATRINISSFLWSPILTMAISLVLIWIIHRQGPRRLETLAAES
ncbi:MAG: hypothetical protein ABJF10_00740 [Chthoniobacter sp.]|uniref:hypothetical protein n=1 Tax=Chthoniobacter sp. TaxID=2510640 RepID=UPI0032A680EE